MASEQPAERQTPRFPAGGFLLFALVSLFSAVRLAFIQGEAAHYTLFVRAARALWEGRTAYGTDFGTGIGHFFYSPACALQIFLPLSFLPDRAGLFLFSLASWAVFVGGARSLLRDFSLAPRDVRTQAFWLLLVPPILGGIAAVKLEVLSTGILLFAASAFARAGPHRAGLLLGFACAWKMQTLPAIGLLALASPTPAFALRFGFSSLAGFLLCLGSPLPFLGAETWVALHGEMTAGLSAHLAGGLHHFENVFAALKGWTGIQVSHGSAKLVTALAGLVSAAAVLAAPRGGSRPLLLALALSGFFSVVFPPLHQNNAMILFAPFALAAVCVLPDPRMEPRAWVPVMLAFALHALAYSDLVPREWKDAVYARKPKLFAHALLLYAFLRASKSVPSAPAA